MRKKRLERDPDQFGAIRVRLAEYLAVLDILVGENLYLLVIATAN